MIDYSAYTLGANQPLNHARILYAPITGAVSGDGVNPDYAANDYTSQRWLLNPGSQAWLLQAAVDSAIDCVFIAAHNLAGKTVDIQTASAPGGPYTTRVSIAVPDTNAICVLFNNAGTPYVIRDLKLVVNDGADVAIGVIRAGQALQMPIPLYGGHRPLNLNRITEAQQAFSETGQWLGRILRRRGMSSSYEWEYVTAAWYDANFEPFAKTLPLYPFCIAGNPSKIATDVGFVWTDRDIEIENAGLNTFRTINLPVTGYY